MDLLERISAEADKRSGKPCIRGMRITVDDVLGYLDSGMTEEEILADFPVSRSRRHPGLHRLRAISADGRIIAGTSPR